MRNIVSSPFLFLLSICIGLFACKKTTGNPDPPVDGNYQVTVNNGYGSGTYKPGDTVHIFSAAWAADQVFDKWSGDIGYLQHADEWHEWFMMPAANVGLTAIAKSSASFTPVNTTIRGKNIMKQVYYYFPPNHKGIVYLLHGSGGHAANWINFFEYYSLIKDLVTDGFGFVITEAEEVSLNKDLDGDGAFRWALSPADTINNVDYANIRIITDSLINRGLTDRSKPRYSIGMSNGGAFSAALSMTYQFKAGVSYCAQSGGIIAQLTQRPLQFCMAKNDDNPNVGAAGNATAYNNYQTIKSRGICSQFFTMKDRLYTPNALQEAM